MEKRIIRFKDAAGLVSTTRRCIHNYVKRGLLDAIIIPGNRRALGVTKQSLEKLLRRSVFKASQKLADGGKAVANE